jgi:recombination protein RecR
LTALEELIYALSRLPGIGKKSASRLATFLLKSDSEYNEKLASAILTLKDRVKFCPLCGAYTESETCNVCSDPARDAATICVVEQPQDVMTIEASREYNGLYHVLGGLISPLDGIGPEKLNIGKLKDRLAEGKVREIIIATNPTVEGDTTALFLLKILKDSGASVSRLASGIPVGGDLEYADRYTLARSLRGRVKM